MDSTCIANLVKGGWPDTTPERTCSDAIIALLRELPYSRTIERGPGLRDPSRVSMDRTGQHVTRSFRYGHVFVEDARLLGG